MRKLNQKQFLPVQATGSEFSLYLIFALRIFIVLWILMGVLFCVFFGFLKGSIYLFLGLSMLVWFSGLFFLSFRKIEVDFLSSLAIIPSFLLLVPFSFLGGSISFLSIGFFSIPVALFFFKGSRKGLIWFLSFIFVFALLMGIVSLFPSHAPIGMLIAVLCAIFYLGTLIFFYQREREKQDKRLWDQMYMDKLTGLPNRESLMEDLSVGEDQVLFLINVDGFREINDVFGPRVGDAVLVLLSKNLEELFPRVKYRLYKLAGDEFAFLFELEEDNLQDSILSGIAKLIAEGVARERFEVEGHPVRVRVSIGIANSQLVEMGHLLASADMALKKAKSDHTDFVYFKKIHRTRDDYEKNLKWMLLLLEAVEDQRILAFYQPIYNLETRKVDKYECLIRLILPNGQVIAPFFFLDVASKAKLMSVLTKEMFRQAFETFYSRTEEFSVNLSINEILDPIAREMVLEMLDAYPDVRERLVIEFLETDEIRDYQTVLYFIEQIKKRGCRVAIDDFGSGFSNFKYLANLPIDYLKIDGSLIKNIAEDPKYYSICETIIGFAQKIGLKTIAEFVADEPIYNKVKSLGVDYVQGYFIGKPIPEPLSGDWKFEHFVKNEVS